jgi:hypothetical protein
MLISPFLGTSAVTKKQASPGPGPDWKPLAEILALVVEKGADDEQAKIGICKAIENLSVWVTVKTGPEIYFSKNEIEIPPRLNPNHFDWPNSKPLSQWRTRPSGESDWSLQTILLIEVNSEDVATYFLDDQRSVPISDRSPSGAASPDQRYWKDFAISKWRPSENTREVLPSLPQGEFLSLSQAISIVAFGTLKSSAECSTFEMSSRRQQAARALCDAADEEEVRMAGSRSPHGTVSEWIPLAFFETPTLSPARRTPPTCSTPRWRGASCSR